MSDIVPVMRRISQLDVSPQFDSYSKVIIHVSDDTTYEYGTNTGRTLEFDNPFGSQQMCRDILTRLQGYQYQPYTADGTILNPAAEIGDALNSSLVYGGIYTRSKTFGRLMKADVSAPEDEEINHEYQYEDPKTREFKRAIDNVSAQLEIANDNINAKVSQTGGSNSSFAWTLTASGFTLTSNSKQVMKCDSNGLTVTGKISATSGTIGGFTIGSSALYTNSYSSYSSPKTSGVHISASGIRLGKNFSVDSSGNVTGSNATFDSVTIKNSTVSGTFSGTGSGTFSGKGSFSSGSLGGGMSFGSGGKTVNGVNNAIGSLENRVSAIYADYINTNNLSANISKLSQISCNGLRISLRTVMLGSIAYVSSVSSDGTPTYASKNILTYY